ncbi:MAG: SH3 domain-containing protein [Clostridia bacterium]|nr:SH3 domain-containing protein [Clostridia bacterium]
MTRKRSRVLSLFLALCLGVSLIPSGVFLSSAKAESYGMVINGSVRLRREASTNSAYWFVLPVGWVCEIHSETNAGGNHWYRVIAPHPEATDPSTARTYWGYITDQYFRPLTEQETADYLAGKAVTATVSNNTGATTTTTVATTTTTSDSASSSSTSTTVTGTTGSISSGGTNFREGPGKKYRSMMKLDRGTVVNITSVPDGIGDDYWYGVSYAGLKGYVNSEFVRILSGNAAAAVTISPTATPTPTAAPPSTTGYNAVQLILTSAHLRTSPNGTYNRENDWEGMGSVLPLAGAATNAAGYTWYPVEKDGRTYYVRNDCVKLVSSSSVSISATPTPTAAPIITAEPTTTTAPVTTSILGYVTTTKSGCNLRATPAGTTIKQIAKNVTLPYLLAPVQKSGYTWYYVDADGNRGYLRSDVVKVTSTTENTSDNTSSDSPADANVTQAPAAVADSNATGYVKTTSSDVNLRIKAGYTSLLGRISTKGTVLAYYGEPTTVNGVTWYRVYTSNLGYGYVHGSYVTIVNADGSSTPTPEPTEAPTGAVVTATTSQTEATYTTLKLGSTGTAVTELVQALKDRGYFTGTVTSKYTSAVEKAVRAFQRAAGLSVDGIAGAATQHALYGTVPVGAADSSNLTMTIYPAEKIDWWTGGINEMWAKGANYKVYDVKTGIVWWAHRWSGGYHVDCEPLTAADTARLCKAYGVTTAQEIANKNLYQRRPSLVTIGNRTFACSLYGIPHNYPEGDTIATNDMKGQVCLHFTNSWTHGSKKVDSLHTEAIQYAIDNAPNGHK